MSYYNADEINCMYQISDSQEFQEDPNSLYNRSLDNNWYFGMTKCVLHSLSSKSLNTYYLGNFALTNVSTHHNLAQND